MRFGILGYGGIAQRFVHDSLQVEEAEITWIASQTPAKREAAAAAVPDARIADNYQACLASPEVDCVYIALPHAQHKAMTLAALAQHKHVLVEKPAAFTSADWDQLCAEAKRQDCFLMEALKTPFYPTSAIVKNLIEDGAIGQVTGADVNYCYDLKGQTKPGWYILDPLQGGALYDIGSYLYYFVLDLFPDLTPTLTVTAELRDHIDVHFQCELTTASGAHILTEGAIDRERPREAVIRGTGGTLRIPYYYRAEEIILENARGTQTIRPTIQYTDLAGEIAEVCRCVGNGWRESPLYPQAKTREVLALMEAIRSQFPR